MGGGTNPDADVDKGIGIRTDIDIDDKNIDDNTNNNVRDISSPSTPEHEQELETKLEPTSSTTKQEGCCDGGILRRIYGFITWTPPRCRWDPKNPPKFNLALNLLFGFAATFTVRSVFFFSLIWIVFEVYVFFLDRVSGFCAVVYTVYAVYTGTALYMDIDFV